MPDPDEAIQNRDLADDIIDSRVVAPSVTFDVEVTSPKFQTATIGQRGQLAGPGVRLFTGDPAEVEPALFSALAVGTTAATKLLRTRLEAPIVGGGTVSGGTRIHINTETGDDSTRPPRIDFLYDGASAQQPRFILFGYDMTLTSGNLDLTSGNLELTNGVVEITALGSSTSPTIGIGSNFDDGMFSPSDSELGFTIGGVEKVRIEAERADFDIGDLKFLKIPVKTDAGDPSGSEDGDMYVNTSDNVFRLRADSAWRTVFSW